MSINLSCNRPEVLITSNKELLEQQISLLNIISEELKLLNNYNYLLKKQKQGLMQKLLIGEWRVPLDQEAEHG